MTKKDRLLVNACIILSLVAIGLFGTLVYQIATADEVVAVGEVPPPVSVGVQAGDTLWDLAKEFYPNSHTGKAVEAIRQLNPDVDPGRLQIGQMIQLPSEV